MVLLHNPKWMYWVAAVWRTKRLLHRGVVDGRRPTTHHRAEPARERPRDFRLVQVPVVPVDALERINPKCVGIRKIIGYSYYNELATGRHPEIWPRMAKFSSLSLQRISTCWPLVAILKFGRAWSNYGLRNSKQFPLAWKLLSSIANKGSEIVFVRQISCDTF